MNPSESAAGTPGGKVAKRRPRTRSHPYLPRYLKSPQAQAAMAHGRCLMMLAVLSGQKTVTQAIEEAKISRALYYQLELRALKGMMRALDPRPEGARSEWQELRQARRRVKTLSAQLRYLTQRKRSVERLLRMVMKSSRTPLSLGRGRPPGSLSRRTMPGADSP